MPTSGYVEQPVPRGDPQWGEVLQLPNLRSQFDIAGAVRDAWMARNGSMTSAQQTAMDQLSAALKAERDAKMAELMKQNAGKGGRGGRGGGGGGGASPITLPSNVEPSTPWDYSPTTAPAPSLNMHLYPSDVYGPSRVYSVPNPGGRALLTARAGQSHADVGNNRGRTVQPKPKPSLSRLVLS